MCDINTAVSFDYDVRYQLTSIDTNPTIGNNTNVVDFKTV